MRLGRFELVGTKRQFTRLGIADEVAPSIYRGLIWGLIARGSCSIGQLPNSPVTQLPNYPITQLPNYPITQLPNYPITQLPNYPITQLPNYPVNI